MSLNLAKVEGLSCDPNIIKAKFLKEYSEKVDKKYFITKYLDDPQYNTLAFDLGWVIFKIVDEECIIVSYYRNHKSKEEKDTIWDAFKAMLKDNGCKKITMYTSINPEMWKRRYGFKLSRYEMELDI